MNYACPFCAESFETKSELNRHWLTNPVCARNRHVSNQLQTKYGMAAGIENIPGEGTLNRIRQEGCEHPEPLREPIYADTSGSGPQQGYRCGHCYTEVYYTEHATLTVTEGSLGPMGD